MTSKPIPFLLISLPQCHVYECSRVLPNRAGGHGLGRVIINFYGVTYCQGHLLRLKLLYF